MRFSFGRDTKRKKDGSCIRCRVLSRVSIPHRKRKKYLAGGRSICGSRRFPSLIGSVKSRTLIKGDMKLPQVSIPYRKYKKQLFAPDRQASSGVSIPYRKYKKQFLIHLRIRSSLVSIPYRKYKKRVTPPYRKKGNAGFHPL